MGQPKIFVLDTNVILHDHKAIRHFQDNNLVIPIAVVEELDKFKKGNDSLAFNARGFMRDIDRITEGKSFGKDGLPIGPRLGRIKVEPNHPFSGDYADMFKDDIKDHRILATAMWVRDHNPGTLVALVTKDVNLRLKAKAAGMAVQDYLTDKVEESRIENSQREVQVFTLSSDKMQTLLYGPDNALEWESVCSSRPAPNQFFRFKWENNDEETACARYDAVKDRIVLIKMKEAYGIRPRNDEQMMALDALMHSRIDLVSLTGGADYPFKTDSGARIAGYRVPSRRPEDQDGTVPSAAYGQLECHKRPVQAQFERGPSYREHARTGKTYNRAACVHQGQESRKVLFHHRRGPEPYPS